MRVHESMASCSSFLILTGGGQSDVCTLPSPLDMIICPLLLLDEDMTELEWPRRAAAAAATTPSMEKYSSVNMVLLDAADWSLPVPLINSSTSSSSSEMQGGKSSDPWPFVDRDSEATRLLVLLRLPLSLLSSRGGVDDDEARLDDENCGCSLDRLPKRELF